MAPTNGDGNVTNDIDFTTNNSNVNDVSEKYIEK